MPPVPSVARLPVPLIDSEAAPSTACTKIPDHPETVFVPSNLIVSETALPGAPTA